MSKEVLKMALEALESLKVTVSSRTEANVIDGVDLFPTQIAALRQALANEALDKKAENARELGLDYEPVWGGGPTNKDYEDAMRQRRLHQLTSPPAQRTWVGLTDADKQEAFDETQEASGGFWEFADYLEAKLKEKNT